MQRLRVKNELKMLTTEKTETKNSLFALKTADDLNWAAERKATTTRASVKDQRRRTVAVS